jgi:acyl carrier protein
MADTLPDALIAAAVTEVLSDILSVPEQNVVPGARLVDDLDADSLDFAEIAAALSARGFPVDKADLKTSAATVADLVTLLGSPADPA